MEAAISSVTSSDRPRRRQVDRRAEAERKLVSTATQLIATRGIEGLRLADIGQIAGYSRGLATHYFGTKEELISQVVRHIFIRYNLVVNKNPHTPGLEQVCALVREHMRALSDEAPEVLALQAIYGAAATNSLLQPIVAEVNRERIAALATGFESAVAMGEIVKIDHYSEAVQLQSFIRGIAAMYITNRDIDIVKIADEHLEAMRARLAPRG